MLLWLPTAQVGWNLPNISQEAVFSSLYFPDVSLCTAIAPPLEGFG